MKYSDFVLHFRPGEVQQTYRVTACSAAGTATGVFRIPPALQGGGALLEPAERAGTELFLALFHESVLRLLDFEKGRLENGKHPGLNLQLHFAVEGQDLAQLDSLPWELLRDPRTDSQVARRTSRTASERLSDMETQKRNRHAELVDKKFRSLLTKTEQAELLQLQTQLDEADSRFYEPIEKKLELALTKLRQRSQAR